MVALSDGNEPRAVDEAGEVDAGCRGYVGFDVEIDNDLGVAEAFQTQAKIHEVFRQDGGLSSEVADNCRAAGACKALVGEVLAHSDIHHSVNDIFGAQVRREERCGRAVVQFGVAHGNDGLTRRVCAGFPGLVEGPGPEVADDNGLVRRRGDVCFVRDRVREIEDRATFDAIRVRGRSVERLHVFDQINVEGVRLPGRSGERLITVDELDRFEDACRVRIVLLSGLVRSGGGIAVVGRRRARCMHVLRLAFSGALAAGACCWLLSDSDASHQHAEWEKERENVELHDVVFGYDAAVDSSWRGRCSVVP